MELEVATALRVDELEGLLEALPLRSDVRMLGQQGGVRRSELGTHTNYTTTLYV